MEKETQIKKKQMKHYDKRHKTKDLSELKNGDVVWIVDLKEYGRVLKKLDQPRSYLVESNNGKYRRNRWHLILSPNISTENFTDSEEIYIPDEDLIIHNNDQNNIYDHVNPSTLEESPSMENLPRLQPSLEAEEIPEVGPSSRVSRQKKTPHWFKDYVLE